MKLQLLRNATLLLTVNGKTILVDPMLAAKGSYDPFQFTANQIKNPTVGLPVNEKELHQIISELDAVLLTHLHLDHWDAAAQKMLSKHLPVFCQPGDEKAIQQAGFTHVQPIVQAHTWHDIHFNRTSGRHGTGDIGKRMGTVSGYVITHGNDAVYIAGDTIWCEEVEQAVQQYQPTHIVVNGSGAKFIMGDAIVMDIKDIVAVCSHAPSSQIYVIHLEAVNHAVESRADIRAALKQHNLETRCFVPDDGDRLF